MGLFGIAKSLMGKNGINIDSFLPTGNQYCPDCHTVMAHRDGYYECEICNYSITDDEAEDGYGHPTLESTYEDDIYNDSEFAEYRKPEECKACGGPYPHCTSTCEMYDED